MKHTLYTVQKINLRDEVYGAVHGSMDANKTVCGKEINHRWYVLNNTFDGMISCRKCLVLLANTETTHAVL